MQIDVCAGVFRQRVEEGKVAPPRLDLRPPVAQVDRLNAWIERVVSGAMIYAEAATGAVLDRDLQREALVRIAARIDRCGEKAFRRSVQQGGVIGLGPDHAVRADEAALAALDTALRFPDGHLEGAIALRSEERRVGRECGCTGRSR